MKLAILSLAVASSAAFTTLDSFRASTKLNSAMDDLKAIAEKSNPVLKVSSFSPRFHGYSITFLDSYISSFCLQFYDPLQLSSTTIFNESNDATIAFLRHSEIKHGRIAMAAFVGYIIQANGIHFPWPMTTSGMPFPSDAGSPPEQWDALPDVAKVR